MATEIPAAKKAKTNGVTEVDEDRLLLKFKAMMDSSFKAELQPMKVQLDKMDKSLDSVAERTTNLEGNVRTIFQRLDQVETGRKALSS